MPRCALLPFTALLTLEGASTVEGGSARPDTRNYHTMRNVIYLRPFKSFYDFTHRPTIFIVLWRHLVSGNEINYLNRFFVTILSIFT